MHDTKGAQAMKRFGSAAWNRDLREGKGSTESRALESHPHVLQPLRREAGHESGGAAWGGSRGLFTVSFVRLLGMTNFVPEQVDGKSEVVIDKDAFRSIAAKAKAGCPVSKLMKVEIGFGA